MCDSFVGDAMLASLPLFDRRSLCDPAGNGQTQI
jgi:hypothetical protein